MGSVRRLSGRDTLFMDFRYLGKRCREYTALEDTPANRKRLEKALARIEADMEAGTFDYAATFPTSRNAITVDAARAALRTFWRIADAWKLTLLEKRALV
jgi:integrase